MALSTFQTEKRMQDTLLVGTRTSATSPSAVSGDWTYDEANPVKCHVVYAKPSEADDGSEATLSNPSILIPVSNTSCTGVKRVKVTHRDRTELATPEEYAVLGDPENLRGSKRMNCRLIVGKTLK